MRDKNTVLLDADYICFMCAAGKDEEDLTDVLERLNDVFYSILYDCHLAFAQEEMEFISFLSGGNSLRKKKYPDYKANREGRTPPKHLQECRMYAEVFWNGVTVKGIEADDAIGICSANLNPKKTIVATADKDFCQMANIWVNDIYPGRIMHPRKVNDPFIAETLTQDGVWFRTTELSALKQLCHQLIYGDAGDGVKGLSQFASMKKGHKKKAQEVAFTALDNGKWTLADVTRTVRAIYKSEFGDEEGNRLFNKVFYLVFILRSFVNEFESIPKGEAFEVRESLKIGNE